MLNLRNIQKAINYGVVCGILALSCVTGASASDFKYTGKFAQLQTLNTQEAYDMYITGDVALIDTRSMFEWEIKRVINSVSVDVKEPEFVSVVGIEVGFEKIQTKKLIFMCYGQNCMRSPNAALKMIKAGYPARNIFVYHEGINAWTKAHPELTMLFDEQVTATNPIMDDSFLKSRSLNYKQFTALANSGENIAVVDLRLRSANLPKLKGIQQEYPRLSVRLLAERAAAGRYNNGKLLVWCEKGKKSATAIEHMKHLGHNNIYHLASGYEGAKKEMKKAEVIANTN